ncbi:DUF3140 domain-containing protein [Larkinella terrae]|uniref:DUF3140 domain-containing protein n=1 Tax=Larkinella terrae TaxID=2025311 RepID=A0A7K0EMH1_9BACT|nr:DUF3140 domain-containing protein [Larkinella terrae]MRS62912.1 DUF3140 domain-containing protein [Larkinella terrae]
MEDNKKKEVFEEFGDLVNMSPSELEKWLETDESKSVGWDSGDGESVGHKSGEKIIRIKRKKRSDLDERDYEHMQKVVGYIKRHSAQRPEEVKGSNWAYSLKNWGHNPEK